MSASSDRASWLRLDNVANPAPAIAAMWEESKARLGYVPETPRLYPELRVDGLILAARRYSVMMLAVAPYLDRISLKGACGAVSG